MGSDSTVVDEEADKQHPHNQIISEFELYTGLSVRRKIEGAKYTTFSIGGPLECLVELNTVEEVQFALRALRLLKQPYRILGAGSNVLIPSEGMQEWVLKLGREFRYYLPKQQGEIEVGGAMALMTLARELSQAGFSGLEFAGGIPASFGGAIRMNAGAHGGELCSCLREVSYVTADGELNVVPAQELVFSYRYASIPEGAVVVGAKISLSEGDRDQIAKQREEFLAHRKRCQPLTLPSAGSVFKNPDPELTAGKLLDLVGLKGSSSGGAEVSWLHANWIVNPRRDARSEDVVSLIERCQKAAKEARGIELTPEIVRW